jgi:hypothetical protein
MAESQFDTIYHEHFSYFSLRTVSRLATRHGLKIIDVEEWPTHGGSLRVYLAHQRSARPVDLRVVNLLERERRLGFDDLATYRAVGEQVKATSAACLLPEPTKRRGSASVVTALREGNNPAERLRIADFIDFTVDRSPTSTAGSRRSAHPDPSDRPIDAARPDTSSPAVESQEKIVRQMPTSGLGRRSWWPIESGGDRPREQTLKVVLFSEGWAPASASRESTPKADDSRRNSDPWRHAVLQR